MFKKNTSRAWKAYLLFDRWCQSLLARCHHTSNIIIMLVLDITFYYTQRAKKIIWTAWLHYVLLNQVRLSLQLAQRIIWVEWYWWTSNDSASFLYFFFWASACFFPYDGSWWMALWCFKRVVGQRGGPFFLNCLQCWYHAFFFFSLYPPTPLLHIFHYLSPLFFVFFPRSSPRNQSVCMLERDLFPNFSCNVLHAMYLGFIHICNN